MKQKRKARRLLFIWMVSLLAALLSFEVLPDAPIPIPGESNYILKLTSFATHAGRNAMELTYAPDGSGRVFVSTQSGQVFVYSKQGDPLGTFLDLSQVGVGFEYDDNLRVPFKGLMYIAFHPDYAKPDAPGYGKFYTAHQVELSDAEPDYNSKAFGSLGDTDVRFMLAQWQADPDNPDRIDPASHRRVMLLHFHTYGQMPHALGEIAFNLYAKPGEPDYGKLYIAVGDAHNGNYGQSHNLERSQSTDNPFAKILRIDPLQDGDNPYTIPEDNPFDTEVYATGLRDAQWFSFAKDLEGQAVLVGCDIGALLVEEINIIRSGGNYGWDRYEGTLDFDTDRQIIGSARPPVVQYSRHFPKRIGEEATNAGMVAIMGGLVVSDPDDPSFTGQILFGDLPSGTFMHANYHHALTVEQDGRQSLPSILTLKLGNKQGTLADVLGTERGDGRFGIDEAGTVYVVSKQSNTIFKTGLVYTGLPIESAPRIDQGDISTDWAMWVIIFIAVSLIALLLFVVKQNKPGQSESPARVEN